MQAITSSGVKSSQRRQEVNILYFTLVHHTDTPLLNFFAIFFSFGFSLSDRCILTEQNWVLLTPRDRFLTLLSTRGSEFGGCETNMQITSLCQIQISHIWCQTIGIELVYHQELLVIDCLGKGLHHQGLKATPLLECENSVLSRTYRHLNAFNY